MIGRKEAWDILEEAPRRLRDLGDADDFPEEAGALPAEPGALPGDGEVLAGKSSGEEINAVSHIAPALARSVGSCSAHQPLPDSANIRCSLDSGPPGGEDALAEGVNLDLSDDGEAGSLESTVEASDSCEE